MTADEKDALLAAYHPDYKEEGFITLKVGPNKGEKVPTELGYLLESNSRILGVDIDLDKVDYDVDGTSLSVPAEQVLLQRSRHMRQAQML